MSSSSLQVLAGRQVNVALRGGCGSTMRQLVRATRPSTEAVWLFSNGADVFVEAGDVIEVWEVGCTGQAA